MGTQPTRQDIQVSGRTPAVVRGTPFLQESPSEGTGVTYPRGTPCYGWEKASGPTDAEPRILIRRGPAPSFLGEGGCTAWRAHAGTGAPLAFPRACLSQGCWLPKALQMQIPAQAPPLGWGAGGHSCMWGRAVAEPGKVPAPRLVLAPGLAGRRPQPTGSAGQRGGRVVGQAYTQFCRSREGQGLALCTRAWPSYSAETLLPPSETQAVTTRRPRTLPGARRLSGRVFPQPHSWEQRPAAPSGARGLAWDPLCTAFSAHAPCRPDGSAEAAVGAPQPGVGGQPCTCRGRLPDGTLHFCSCTCSSSLYAYSVSYTHRRVQCMYT